MFWQDDCRLDLKEYTLEGEDLRGVRLKFSKSDKLFSDCQKNDSSNSMLYRVYLFPQMYFLNPDPSRQGYQFDQL